MPELETLPDQIGTFRILREIGRGGMGCVYLAEDSQLHRQVALKVMLPELREKPIAKERFLREARAMAGVKSDHVVTIHHVSEADGMPFFVMEYLEGQPLDRFLDAADSTRIDELLRIASEVCEGLRAAHAEGLVHRDIKPSNVFLEAPNGRVKILDFGLARPQERITELTRSGDVVGSPHYMAPEQAAGEPVDFRADLFSLGAMLFRMTTGRLPFKGNTTYEILMSLATHTPPPLDELNPQVPGRLSQLVEKLLRKKPDERPGSITEVLTDLQHLRLNRGESTESIRPRPDSVSQAPTVTRRPVTAAPSNPSVPTLTLSLEATSAPTPNPDRRLRNRLRIAVAALVLTSLALYFATRPSDEPPSPNEDPSTLVRQYLEAAKEKDFARMQEIRFRVEQLPAAHKEQVMKLTGMGVTDDPVAIMKGFGEMFKSMSGVMTDVMKEAVRNREFP